MPVTPGGYRVCSLLRGAPVGNSAVMYIKIMDLHKHKDTFYFEWPKSDLLTP